MTPQVSYCHRNESGHVWISEIILLFEMLLFDPSSIATTPPSIESNVEAQVQIQYPAKTCHRSSVAQRRTSVILHSLVQVYQGSP